MWENCKEPGAQFAPCYFDKVRTAASRFACRGAQRGGLTPRSSTRGIESPRAWEESDQENLIVKMEAYRECNQFPGIKFPRLKSREMLGLLADANSQMSIRCHF
jgi:hypothetical protein